ncbi:Gfo/Idh/MocA family protein [Aerococcus kribbianus]|uniref:Gfo/Idh/MocA family oxidoreductase n=1 Tax=Aerococcus kribbianus TaxID=2999064 RepID=A0A9X3FS12_9LACT|nr:MULTISPECIES: Gfo/Idh/MocA family oxidoreductase [unclassified Aerococcus]MCZ0717347.1 Gfo/Idh/MocA family oxidoreductase [Aerococcus sp. YH-aer221]MCZ0725635.1 Gfo/Idh/MocA family oxidoreductase [Aerococcus sp. YH-aer222]
MVEKKDGMNYAPSAAKTEKVVADGEFNVAVVALDHGHIYGMSNGLQEAGATLKYVYDPDPQKVAEYKESFPQVEVADSLEAVLADPEIQLVAAAAIPNRRSALGNRVMEAGKDYFTDKTGFTSLEQLEETKRVVAETKQKYWVYFSERLHVEGAVYADQIIKSGRIGDVIQVTGFGPHRLDKEKRPDWFFDREQYGGILTDIGSHQIEQFLHFTGNEEAQVVHSQIANYANADTPDLDDYGDAVVVGENGASFFFKVHWFTPDGLSTWGDGRTFITGTKGSIEIRKYLDLARDEQGDHVYVVDQEGEHHYAVNGEVGFPFFGQMILDCINRTDKAMTQEHIFKAQELCLQAQAQANKIH